MQNEMRLTTANGKLVVSFGHSLTFECRDNYLSFEFWWFDLWPEHMETIKRCLVWEDAPVTFKQFEKMIEDYDDNHIHDYSWQEPNGELTPIWTGMDIEHMEHHYLNH